MVLKLYIHETECDLKKGNKWCNVKLREAKNSYLHDEFLKSIKYKQINEYMINTNLNIMHLMIYGDQDLSNILF